MSRSDDRIFKGGMSSRLLPLPTGWEADGDGGTGSATLAQEQLLVQEDNEPDARPCVLATIVLTKYLIWMLALSLFCGKISLFFKPLLFLTLLHQPVQFPNLYSA